jgi:hypothetical protein
MGKGKEARISRKEALKKMGVKALTVASMMTILNNPARGQDDPNSPEIPPDWP